MNTGFSEKPVTGRAKLEGRQAAEQGEATVWGRHCESGLQQRICLYTFESVPWWQGEGPSPVENITARKVACCELLAGKRALENGYTDSIK